MSAWRNKTLGTSNQNQSVVNAGDSMASHVITGNAGMKQSCRAQLNFDGSDGREG